MVKPAFTDEIKTKRMTAARHLLQLLQRNPEQWYYGSEHMPRALADMVFIDAASIQVVPAGGKVWVSMLKEDEREHVVVDDRLNTRTGFKLAYYIAVNAQEGVLDPWAATGTTNLAQRFHVSGSPYASNTMLPGVPAAAAAAANASSAELPLSCTPSR